MTPLTISMSSVRPRMRNRRPGVGQSGGGVPHLDQIAQRIAHERCAFPVQESEHHLADRAVGLGHRGTGFRIDQLEQAVVFGDELHAGSAVRRFVRRDAVERRGRRRCDRRPWRRNLRPAGCGLPATPPPGSPTQKKKRMPSSRGRPAGALRRLLDQIAAEGRGCQQGYRPGEIEILQHPVGTALNADRDNAGAEMLDAVGQWQAAGEHAERDGLKHDIAGPDAGAPVFARMHFVDHGDIARGVGVEGRRTAGARGRDDSHDFLARRAGEQFERVAEAVQRFLLRSALVRLVHQRQTGEILKGANVARLGAGPGELRPVEGRAVMVIAELSGQPVPLQGPQRVAGQSLGRRIPQKLLRIIRRHRLRYRRRRKAGKSRTTARSRRPARKRRPGHARRRPENRPGP